MYMSSIPPLSSKYAAANMRAHTGERKRTACLPADTEAHSVEDLCLGCGETPQGKGATQALTASSVVASLCIHISAAAFGAILSAYVALSPAASPQGECFQVELVVLRTAGSDASPGASVLPPQNAGPPSSPGEAETQAAEEHRPRTPGTAQERKPADLANSKRKRRMERAIQAGVAQHGEALPKNGQGARASSGYGNEAAPVGTHSNPRPEYPEMARQRGQEGKTVLLVDVNIQGDPVEIQILKSSGYSLLDKAATTTVWRWKFTPARKGGASVPGQVILPVEFCLR